MPSILALSLVGTITSSPPDLRDDTAPFYAWLAEPTYSLKRSIPAYLDQIDYLYLAETNLTPALLTSQVSHVWPRYRPCALTSDQASFGQRLLTACLVTLRVVLRII